MKVLVGDEFGLLKCVDINKKLVIAKSGEIKKNNAVMGIGNLFETDNNNLAIAHQHNFYVMNWSSQEIKSQPELSLNDKTFFTSQVIKRTIDFSSVILSSTDNKLSLFQFDDEVNLTSSNEFDIKTQKLQMIKDGPTTQEIFCLFKGTPISVYNLEKNEFTWRGKNVPNDELNLRVPIWDVDVAYSSQNTNSFYTATAYGEIRTYDRKVKPRPIAEKKMFDRKINRMLLSNCENYLTIGDTMGNIQMLDKRKNLSSVKTLKGSTGAVKDMAHLKNTNITMSCGLDRFLRVWDYKTSEDLPQLYLKNKLSVIFPYEVSAKEESEDNSEEEKKEDEDEDDFMEEGEFDEEDDDEEDFEDNEEGNEDEEDIEDEDFEEVEEVEEKIKAKSNKPKPKKK